MFTDVYENMPVHIQEQWEDLQAHLKRHGKKYGVETWQNGEKYV